MKKTQPTTFLGNLQGIKKDSIARSTRRSLEWLTNKIRKGNIDKRWITNRPLLGRMMTFVYDPKGKKTLPYWDRNPLIFVIGNDAGSYLGLNLHYLAPKQRAIFLDRLMQFQTGKNENAKLKLTYQMLKGTRRLKMFQPTIKRYLKSHRKTRMVIIPPDEWEMAVMLPYARFVGQSNTSVYSKSRKMYS